MAEYIDRVALENAMTTAAVTGKDRDRRIWAKAICVLHDMPTADVAPVRHGRWIDAYPDIEPNPMFMYGICSECGSEQGISKYLNYCPNCGAKMDDRSINGEDE